MPGGRSSYLPMLLGYGGMPGGRSSYLHMLLGYGGCPEGVPFPSPSFMSSPDYFLFFCDANE